MTADADPLTAEAERLGTVRRVVEAVDDPELAGVTIGDLGMVLDVRIGEAGVIVDLAPTFLGCVAVGLICLDVQSRVLAHDRMLTSCDVRVVQSTWSTDRINANGVTQLKELGIVVVRSNGSLEETSCPYCGEASLEARGGSGPTRCRTVAWCNSCRTVVEAMRPKGVASVAAQRH